jgi:hypothetical protein
MALLKVTVFAVALGVLFGVAGLFLLSGIEKSAGNAAPIVIMGFTGIGLLLGAIAGATQAIVDAINSRPG